MKKIWFALNEQEHKDFHKKAEEAELSDYALSKRIVLEYVYGDVPSNSDDAARPYANKVKTLKRQQKWASLVIFVLSCYFVVSLTYILLF